MNKKPYISKELVDLFKTLFPNKLPQARGITPSDISYLQGQQSVIDRLEFLYNDDQPDEV